MMIRSAQRTLLIRDPGQTCQLADIPFRVLAATAKDVNRKPDVGMFSTLSETFSKQDVAIGSVSFMLKAPFRLLMTVS